MGTMRSKGTIGSLKVRVASSFHYGDWHLDAAVGICFQSNGFAFELQHAIRIGKRLIRPILQRKMKKQALAWDLKAVELTGCVRLLLLQFIGYVRQVAAEENIGCQTNRLEVRICVWSL